MRDGEEADIDHCFAEAGLDDAVAHADDEEEEEGEGVAARVEDGIDEHEDFGARVEAVRIFVVIESPCHELFDNQEDDDGGDVVLDGKDVVTVLGVEETPEDADDGVDNGDAGVEGEFCDLRRW